LFPACNFAITLTVLLSSQNEREAVTLAEGLSDSVFRVPTIGHSVSTVTERNPR
jgi:hypothetical protein